MVIGDPRMAHDPLRTQRRATIVGVLIALLIAGGAAMMGILRPQPSLEGANLVEDEHGSLHVRLEDGFHPITNVASARLLLGEPVEIHRSTSRQLAGVPLRQPMGIPTVPGLDPAPARNWVMCDPGVVAAVEGWTPHRYAVLQAASGLWLINGQQRTLVPAGTDRALGAQEISVSEAVVEQFERRADAALPAGATGLPEPFDAAGRVYRSGDRVFLSAPGGVAEVTGERREFAEAFAREPVRQLPLAAILSQPRVAVLPDVPGEDVEWMELSSPRGGGHTDGGHDVVCVGEQGLATIPRPVSGSVGDYLGPRGTAALETERGFALVSATGMRFSVSTEADIRALGFSDYTRVPSRVLAPLPDGGVLSEERARANSATINTMERTPARTRGTE